MEANQSRFSGSDMTLITYDDELVRFFKDELARILYIEKGAKFVRERI